VTEATLRPMVPAVIMPSVFVIMLFI
jgi:hypothetical protein